MRDEYSDFVQNLMKDMGSKEGNLVHDALGIAGESGEVVDLIKKHYAYDKPLDTEKLIEEIGDLLFYIQSLCNHLGIPPDFIIKRNMEKLRARYHTGQYSDTQAISRADKNGV